MGNVDVGRKWRRIGGPPCGHPLGSEKGVAITDLPQTSENGGKGQDVDGRGGALSPWLRPREHGGKSFFWME